MFNIGSGEISLIAVVALLVLGPKRLPELARGIGKFMREFRRQTDEVRGVVEREFYQLDRDISAESSPLVPQPAPDALALNSAELHEPSQLTSGMPQGEPVPPVEHSPETVAVQPIPEPTSTKS